MWLSAFAVGGGVDGGSIGGGSLPERRTGLVSVSTASFAYGLFRWRKLFSWLMRHKTKAPHVNVHRRLTSKYLKRRLGEWEEGLSVIDLRRTRGCPKCQKAPGTFAALAANTGPALKEGRTRALRVGVARICCRARGPKVSKCRSSAPSDPKLVKSRCYKRASGPKGR